MSEEQNIPRESQNIEGEGHKVENPQTTNNVPAAQASDHHSADQKEASSPQQSLPEPQTTNYQPQIAPMEVHHPHHLTHKKKWTEYLLEFFMLFLAVFLGFIAENIREHSVEKNREKQFMHSLVEDLKTDTAMIAELNPFRLKTQQMSDSLYRAMVSKSYAKNGYAIYDYVRFTSRRRFFYSADGTMQQLKYSGGLRLVGNRQVADSIKGYDVFYRSILQLQELEETQLTNYRGLVVQVFNVAISEKFIGPDFNALKDSLRKANPQLMQNDRVLLNEFMGLILYKMGNSFVIYSSLETLKRKAEQLIKLIKKEYDLK